MISCAPPPKKPPHGPLHQRSRRYLLGLTDRRLLDKAESIIWAEGFLLDLPEETNFTVALLLNLHREAFGREYEWAGQYRRSDPNVGDFLPPLLRLRRV